METSSWTISPFVRDSLCMIGNGVGGMASSWYGFNYTMPIVQRWIKRPMMLQYLVCSPPVFVFSAACAGFAGGALPALAQLVSSSYHAGITASSMPTASQDEKMHKSRSSSPL
ncbi:hypothetical protein QJS10_CPA16g01320 [Acorus calamus]|uniref:Uncharacterized protein n=1 Tax=Acorus calamus TaxID=4465 RepID=A0AAV9CYU0_ACOCL|nr:hypothetical protein QJS10_CPA16g01320 [Acorus calamus]